MAADLACDLAGDLAAVEDPILVVAPSGGLAFANTSARALLHLSSNDPLPMPPTAPLWATAVRRPAGRVVSHRQGTGKTPAHSSDGHRGAEPLDSLVILHLLTAEDVPAREPPPKVPHDAAMAKRKPGAHDRYRLSLLVDERDALLAELRSTAEARDRAERDRDEVLARLYRSQSAEREHLARELHDEVGQQLAWLTLNLRRLSTSPTVTQGVEASLEQVEAIASTLRRVVHDLRPDSLSERGLTLALGSLVREWSDRSGIAIDFQLSGTTVALALEIEVTLFRLVQEALTNVLKHAPATRQVSITLHFGRASVALTLEDDGPGLAPEWIPGPRPGTGGFGLPGMRERLALLGGDLVIESTPGRGVTLLARVPVRSE